MAPATFRETLRNIVEVAETIRSCILSSPKTLPTQNLLDCSPVFDKYFPPPEPIVGALKEFGINDQTALRLSGAYLRAASRLHSIHSKNVRITLATCSSSRTFSAVHQSRLLDTLRRAYLERLETWKEKICQKVASSCSRASQSRDGVTSFNSAKKTFRYEFVPLLEACFSKEKSPSKLDKELLAKKTGMTYSQINVWFQNRRNRSRKMDPGAKLVDDHTTGSESSVVSSGDRFLSSCSPPYAFPTVYPPEVAVDPFPCRFGDCPSFDRPCWPKRVLGGPRRFTETTVDDLCEVFAQLQIGDSSLKKGNRHLSNIAICDISSPFIVRPPPAPLPSLVMNADFNDGHSVDDPSKEIANSRTQKQDHQPTRKTSRRNNAGVKRRDSSSLSSLPSESSPSSSILVSTSPTSEVPKKKRRSKITPQREPSARVGGSKKRKARNLPMEESADRTRTQARACQAWSSSPTSSVESLPSLSYSSGSSSSSDSPPTSFVTLFGRSLDTVSSGEFIYPPSITPESLVSQCPLPPGEPDFSFGVTKSPLEFAFNPDLHVSPYSDSLDSILRGLQATPDFPPPSFAF